MSDSTASDAGSPHAASNVIESGQPAPDFTLPDQRGKTHRLADYRGKWVVLYFYPKDATPGCTTEACQFRDSQRDFTERNAIVLGVSPDDGDSHRKFAEKQHLPFALLADTQREVCEAYGVWREKINYGKKYMGLVRTTYLIDPQGLVKRRWDRVKVEGHDQRILQLLDECQTVGR